MKQFLSILILLLSVVNATSGWNIVLDWSSTTPIEGPVLATGVSKSLAIYSDRSKVYWSLSSNGGQSFQPFQVLTTGTKVYSLSLAASTTSRHDGSLFLLAFVDNKVLKRFEYREDGSWVQLEGFSGDVAGCAIAEGKYGDWTLVISLIGNGLHSVMKRPKGSSQWTVPSTISNDRPAIPSHINWSGNIVTKNMHLSCTFSGTCALSWEGATDADKGKFIVTTTNFDPSENSKLVYTESPEQYSFGYVVTDAYIAQFYYVYDQDFYVLMCSYATPTEFKKGNTHTQLPFRQCPDELYYYAIQGRTSIQFRVDVMRHHSSGKAYVMVSNAVPETYNSYIVNCAFFQNEFLETYHPFSERVLTDIGNINSYGNYHQSAVSGSSWIVAFSNQNENNSGWAGRIASKSHNFGNIITSHAASTFTPTRSPTRRPSTLVPTRLPSTLVPTRLPTTLVPTRLPTTKGPTSVPTKQPSYSPSSLPTESPSFTPSLSPSFRPTTKSPMTSHPSFSGDTDSPTNPPSQIPSEQPTAEITTMPTSSPTILITTSSMLSVVTSTGGALLATAVVGFVNALISVLKYGDDMKLYSHEILHKTRV